MQYAFRSDDFLGLFARRKFCAADIVHGGGGSSARRTFYTAEVLRAADILHGGSSARLLFTRRDHSSQRLATRQLIRRLDHSSRRVNDRMH